MKSLVLGSALVALLVSGGGETAFAQEELSDFVLCNRSQARITAVISYYDSDRRHWRSSGWYEIGVDTCEKLGSFAGSHIYYFAEKLNGRYSWPNRNSISINFCAPRARFNRQQIGRTCNPAERLLGFAEVRLRAPGAVVNLSY